MSAHVKFPSLEQFGAIFARETYDEERRSIPYRAKIKLHGTNAGIRVEPDGQVVAQSRTNDLSVAQDHHGFAAWLAPQAQIWTRAAGLVTITFFGEWAGPGIAKGDAIHQTDAKRFYIFAVGVGTALHAQDEEKLVAAWMITDPEAIRGYLPEGLDPDLVRVLPWEDEEGSLTFDFGSEAAVGRTLEVLNEAVLRIAERDPYVWRTFDIDYRGEGLVLVPAVATPGILTCNQYSRLAFKAKTEAHRVKKQRAAAAAREPLPANAIELVDMLCTKARLNQAVDEVCGGTIDVKMTGQVIAWVQNDIRKEGAAEIEATGVPFEKLKSTIADAVRGQFMARLHGIPTAAE